MKRGQLASRSAGLPRRRLPIRAPRKAVPASRAGPLGADLNPYQRVILSDAKDLDAVVHPTQSGDGPLVGAEILHCVQGDKKELNGPAA